MECPVEGRVDRMSEPGGGGATVAAEVAEVSTPPSSRVAESVLKAMVVEGAQIEGIRGDAAPMSETVQAEAAVAAPTVPEPDEQTMPVMPVPPVPPVMPPMPTPEPSSGDPLPMVGSRPSGSGNGSATASGATTTSATDGHDTLTSDQRARAAANREAALKRRAQRSLTH